MSWHSRWRVFVCVLPAALCVCLLTGQGCPPATTDPAPQTSTPPVTELPDTTSPPTTPPPDPPPQTPATASIAGRLSVQSESSSAAAIEAKTQLEHVPASRTVASGTGATADAFVAATQDAPAAADIVAPMELVVTFERDLSPANQDDILAASGLEAIERSPSGAVRARPIASKQDSARRRADSATTATRLQSVPGVRGAEPNARRFIARSPGDPSLSLQWHLSTINLPAAWDVTTGSDDVIIAVIDTGVLSQHPDLQGRITAGYDFISDPSSARDGDGRDSDPEDAGDLFGGPGQSSFHGTHVAAIIGAATDNAVGVAGTTWRGKIMPLRALGLNGGTTFDLGEAIRYAAGLPNISGTVPPKPARVINLSLAGRAGQPASATETSAITEATAAGVLVVAAAGNEGSSLPASPASVPQCLSVSAVDIQLNLAPYSNHGSTVDIAAPGGFNGTDLNGDGYADGILSAGGNDRTNAIRYEYVFSAGTSMAAPQVAGVAALVMAANPSLTGDEVRDILTTTARDLGSAGSDDDFGAGLVDASAAVREATRRAGASPDTTPTLSLSSSTLDFGVDLDVLRVRISNASGGVLNVTGTQVSLANGSGWLQAALEGSASSSVNVSSVAITVKRTGLAQGVYNGTVTVQSSSGSASVAVFMTVGKNAGSEIIYVLVVEPPPNLATVAQAETTSSQNFDYQVSDLPAGSYAVYAGTDRNDDGFICDPGDLCGALPSLLEPAVVALTSGQQLIGEDFAVSERVLHQGSTQPNPQRIARLR